MNCAIFIGAGLVFFAAVTIAADCIAKRVKGSALRIKYKRKY